MREIKFRFWDDNKKKMVYGPTDDNKSPSWVLATCQAYDIEPEQFTGLTDKNGVEIYEGDQFYLNVDKYKYYTKGSGRNKTSEPKFSHREKEKFTVVYNEDGFYESSYTLVNGNKHQSLYKVKELEVIGNIHEVTNET